MCCVHLLALSQLPCMCIYVVIHNHYSITGISNLLFYTSRTQSIGAKNKYSDELLFAGAASPSAAQTCTADNWKQPAGQTTDDCSEWTSVSSVPQTFGGADLPNRSNFPYSLSITTCCPCCIYLVSFKYHQSIRKYIKNTEGRFSPSAPPQTHTCWGNSITFLLCVLTKASCVTLLWSHTDTCTAAVSVWPTHPAEEMQIYWSALGG